jgi:hypothetical protein
MIQRLEMVIMVDKIESTTENWESRKLGCDERFAKAVSPEKERALREAIGDPTFHIDPIGTDPSKI